MIVPGSYPGEEWVSIRDTPYLLSDKGRVYSPPRQGSRGGYLNLYKNSSGYPGYKIHDTFRPIHQLLGEYFIPNPNNYPFVLHEEDNKDDYRIEKLRWGTPSNNTWDYWDNKKRRRQTYTFLTDKGETITTNNLPLWCRENSLPQPRVETSIRRGKVVNTTPYPVDKWGNRKD